MVKKSLLGMIVITLVFTTTGCIFSGSYTRAGNTATFSGDASGTANVSGNTITGTFDGIPFTATRANTSASPFAGAWSGTHSDGVPIEVAVGNTTWVGAHPGIGTGGCIYVRDGNTATLGGHMLPQGIGSATLSGNTMTETFDGASFTATKVSVDSNPFVGTWTGVVDGTPIEIVIGATTWAVRLF